MVDAPTPVSIIILFVPFNFLISLKRAIAAESGKEFAYFGNNLFTKIINFSGFLKYLPCYRK